MKLFIRPVCKIFPGNRDVLVGFAVCSTNDPPLVDEQILAHFPLDTAGKEIMAEFPAAEWGNCLFFESR